MLNVLYGWCGENTPTKQHNDFLITSIDEKHTINSNKNSYAHGGLCSYTKYKPLIHYSDQKYIISILGKLFTETFPQKKNSSEYIIQEVIKLYEQSGCSFIEKLKGQFIFSLIDKTDNSCLIANDTMATFPLFYTINTNGYLLFSNHLKLLTKFSTSQYKLNSQAIYDYIYFHMIPSPETIFQNIFKLEPKQFLFFKNGEYTINSYSPPVFKEKSTYTTGALAKKIFTTLDNSVKNSINSTDTTGCFLSGGLDSSAVAGMLAKNTDNKVKTFSIGFPIAEYNEIDYARTASKTFNTTQFEYFIQPEDIHNIIHDVVLSMDEPFGNSSVIPVYYCAKLAKENGVNHLLAGDGGDEIFAGNTRYSKQKIFEYYLSLPRSIRKKVIEPLVNNSLFNSNYIGRKIKSYVTQACIPLPARLETYNFLHINSPQSVFTDNFLAQINQQAPEELLDKTYHYPDNASSLNRMLYLDWKHTLADNDLRKVNMMCELAGVDVSYPMLTNEMLDLSCSIPSKLKLTSHKLRYLYKKAMKGFLPDSIITKEKHGFGLPFGVWTKTDKDLQKIAYSTINRLKSYNIFNEQFLNDTISKHKNEHASYYGELIWMLMVLGLWLDNQKKGKVHNG